MFKKKGSPVLQNISRLLKKWMRVVQQNGSFFNPLACRREMSGTFLAYWRVFFILIVSLHSKAGLTGALNQYWESKALVLSVYRSMPSAGLCFICTFWSRCAGGGTGELQWRQPFVPRRGTRLAHPETPSPRRSRFSLCCGSWGSPFWAFVMRLYPLPAGFAVRIKMWNYGLRNLSVM